MQVIGSGRFGLFISIYFLCFILLVPTTKEKKKRKKRKEKKVEEKEKKYLGVEPIISNFAEVNSWFTSSSTFP